MQKFGGGGGGAGGTFVAFGADPFNKAGGGAKNLNVYNLNLNIF